MATYSTALQTITLCDSGTFTEFTGYTTGATPALTAENYIHNASAVDQSTGQAQGQQASIAFDYGSNIAWTSGWVIMGWQFFGAPTALDTWANGGMRLVAGSGLGTFAAFNALGNNFGDYPYGGWQCTAIDPTLTADQTVGGGNGGNYRYFGSLLNQTAKITKGSPHAIDAMRYGKAEIKAIGTSANFTDLAAANDATTARWGLFSNRGGIFRWKGLVSLGDASNSVTFSDSNKTVRIEDTPRVASGFNKIEINHASSSVTWDSISFIGVATSITGSAPVSRGDFAVINNGTWSIPGCSFTDVGAFTLGSNTTANGVTWRRAGQITQNGATISNCIVASSHAATSILSNNPGAITNTAFTSDGGNHAIELTSACAGNTYSLTGLTYTNYASSNGSTGNECIFNNSGGAVTLNVSGGNTPTIRNGTGASTTVNSTVSVTWQANVSLSGAEIRVYDMDGAGGTDYGTELAGAEAHSSTTYTYGGAQGNVILLQVMKAGYEEFVQQYTVPSTNTTFDITLRADANA